MILNAGEREVELLFKSVKMEQLGDKLGGNTQFKLQEAAYDSNIKTLALLIKQFSGDFANAKDSDETKGVYAFIDELQEENSIAEIYGQIFEGINQKGFFTPKLQLGAPPIDMKRMANSMSTEMAGAMAQSQIGASLSAATAE